MSIIEDPNGPKLPANPWEWYFLDIRPPADPWASTVDPATWKNNILDVLTKISSSDAGQALLATLRTAAQWIKILPLNFNECQAHGLAIAYIENGRHYNGQVLFDPAVYMSGSACYRVRHTKGSDGNRAKLPDEVMFHEMLHAHRGSLRLSLGNHDPLGGGLARYGNEEEFLAIVITNIYISDPTNHHKSGLRRDWVGSSPLESSLSTSLSFYKSSPQVLPILRKFKSQEKFLFDQLAAVKAAFNPLAALADPKLELELEKLSHSKLALEREKSIPKEPRVLPPRPEARPDQLFKDLGTAGAALAQAALRYLHR